MNQNLNRNTLIQQLDTTTEWDVVVIGGGATGLGIALDATTRGYRTLLLEAKDFAKGTSSRATKLVHGGVRYLAQGDIALVREALKERGRLAKNAPQLFHKQAFVIPGQNVFTAAYYTMGLWVYDRLAGKLGIGRTRYLNEKTVQARLTGIKKDKLQAGVSYYDGQFDDARLATTLMRTILENNGTAINYCPVTGITKNELGKVNGVHCQDSLTGKDYQIKTKAVVNATGVFANSILAMDEPNSKPRIVPSQGVHLVLERDFMPTNDALMIPKTKDGRVLFAVPWHNKLVVGTTDTLVKNADYEPKPLNQEVDFILETAAEYLSKRPTREDVKSVFVGLRPLAAPNKESQSTKEVSRSHKVEIAPSNLVHIFGGKWTTYRQMAEDTIDEAINAGLLAKKPCQTTNLRLHGYVKDAVFDFLDVDPLNVYGSDKTAMQKLIDEDTKLDQKLHANYPYTYVQILWAIKHEMAQTIEDVLARRIRLLFLDAKASKEAAPAVANFMAQHLGWDDIQKQNELDEFLAVADQYQLV